MRYQLFPVNNPLPIKIIWAGYAESPNVTRFCGQREQYIVHYVLSGAGYFNGNKVETGQGFLITPNMQENYYPDKRDPWKFVWFLFDDNSMERLFQEYDADEKTHIFRFDNLETLKETANQIIRLHKQKYSASATDLLEIFLHVFNTQKKTRKTATSSPADDYFNFSIHYIRANLHTKITVDKLTELLGISQPYLYSIFKKDTGLSPKQYIDELRFEKAKRLLLESNLSITQVALSVGFPDVLSFSKFFTAKESLSPTKYRSL